MRTKEQDCLKSKLYYAKNAEMVKAKRRAKYAADPDKEREVSKLRSRKWRKENPGHRNALKAAYKAARLKATPKWANLERITALYQLAAMLNKNTEDKWHVDHIIPLRNHKVCGLHVYENLQVITAKQNMQKHNTYEVA